MVSWVRLGKQSRSFLCKQNWCRNFVTLFVKLCFCHREWPWNSSLRLWHLFGTLTWRKERRRHRQTDRQTDGRTNWTCQSKRMITLHSTLTDETEHTTPDQMALDLLMFHYHVQLHVKPGQLSRMLIRALDSCSHSVIVCCYVMSARLLRVDSVGISLRIHAGRVTDPSNMHDEGPFTPSVSINAATTLRWC